MIRYLLDTNIVSYFDKGINDGLIERMERGFKAQNMAISAVTRAELRLGLEMMDVNGGRRKRITLLMDHCPRCPGLPLRQTCSKASRRSSSTRANRLANSIRRSAPMRLRKA